MYQVVLSLGVVRVRFVTGCGDFRVPVLWEIGEGGEERMSYEQFIESKRIHVEEGGFEPDELAGHLFDYQKAVTRWALKKGKACIFAGTGMGKTAMQLEWARQVVAKAGPVLILTPLAIAHQTEKEAHRFGMITVRAVREQTTDLIQVSNYENLHKFDPSFFSGIVLDESSILKSFSGKIRNQIIDSFARTPYRLACTATPAPNDIEEIGNHAEFVGAMKRVEMLAMFFNHDGGDTSKWRLKGHAQDEFWKWMCQWAMMFTRPSDIGFSDEGFILPELRYHDIRLQSEIKMEGMLFAVAPDLSQKREIRKQTIENRIAEATRIAKKSKGPVIVWCDYNDESTMLAESIKGAEEVTGSQDSETKEELLDSFSDGSLRVLVSKPSICGFGLNWQHCNTMIFAGLSDSWEQFYQAVRRSWRFGQKNPVDVYIVTDGMDSTIANIKRKEEQALTMQRNMIKHMEAEMKKELEGTKADKAVYERDVKENDLYTMNLGDCVEVTRELPESSIDFSVFSPPFASLYTYSNSDRDMGNSRNDKEFYKHFQYLIRELFRVMKEGRVVAVHCMDMPKMKGRDGEIGMKDFSGKIIRSFERCGFVYDGRITIWKNPVVEMQRTKSIRLLHKQLKKDSSVSGPSAPDYLLKFKKRGDNPNPITHTNDSFPVDLWQKIASPVWMDIDQGHTLQYMQARDEKDEKHICPLQLDVIERALMLWTNPGDKVLSPFAGIGSEGYQSLKMGRKFIGIELKRSYYEVAVRNLDAALHELSQENLFPVTA